MYFVFAFCILYFLTGLVLVGVWEVGSRVWEGGGRRRRIGVGMGVTVSGWVSVWLLVDGCLMVVSCLV